jgi:hypothetical protein
MKKLLTVFAALCVIVTMQAQVTGPPLIAVVVVQKMILI